jgi:hypothetical protein
MAVLSESDLQTVIAAYREGKVDDNLLSEVFRKLATAVLTSRNCKLEHVDDFLKEVSDLCFEKMVRYDTNKGKAFNYFTTIIGCYFSQFHRMEMNLRKLK